MVSDPSIAREIGRRAPDPGFDAGAESAEARRARDPGLGDLRPRIAALAVRIWTVARTLGLVVPPTLVTRAAEVIE